MPERAGGRRRQSLTSRVTAFSALAVGVTVTILSIAAYITVRHELYSNLDNSLMSRAADAATATIVTDLTDREVAGWIAGAGDVHIAVVSATGQIVSTEQGSTGFTAALGDQELAVARGDSPSSIRTADTPGGRLRIATVPVGSTGEALVLAQSLAPTELTLHDLGLVRSCWALSASCSPPSPGLWWRAMASSPCARSPQLSRMSPGPKRSLRSPCPERTS